LAKLSKLITIVGLGLLLSSPYQMVLSQNRDVIKKEKQQKQAKEKAEEAYNKEREKAVEHHNKIQTKEVQKRMKKSRKEAEKFNRQLLGTQHKRCFLFKRKR
jgi:hypothetical protein